MQGGAKFAHFEQGLCHLRHSLRLLAQKADKIRRLRPRVRVLGGKQFQLRLHQRKRRAQLVRGISGELPLGAEALVQSIQHLIERGAELPELRQHLLGDLHIREIVRLHLFHLCNKGAQRSECAPADKIRKDPAEQRHRCRDVPVGGAEAPLRPINDDGQLLVGCYELRVKAHRAFLIQDHRAAAL